MSVTNCLTREELSEFVRGKIDATRVDAIAGHVEGCAGCQETVVLLAEQSDTFADALRGSSHDDPFAEESACREALVHITQGGDHRASDRPGDFQRIGPYLILERLGCGGMGTVFKAVHTKLKRTVALKILPASRWASAAAVTRFEREMQAIGQLDHPHIVRASDAGEEFGMHYLVMEYVDGLDLSRIVRRVGPLPVAEVCEIGRQAALGLQYADENRLVHRDIKPSNLILTEPRSADRGTLNGQGKPTAVVKILDLGLALLGDEHAEQRDNLTTVGQLMGTLDYMSPEQGHDCHDVDIRADIYSLGATLFKLLTGRAPFAGPEHNTLLKKLSALANKPAPPIQSLRPETPDAVAAVIDRLLAHEPEDRYSSATEVAAALAPFAREADLAKLLERARHAPEPESGSTLQQPAALPFAVAGSRTKAQSRYKRSRLMTLVGALAGLLLLVFAGFVIRLQTDRGELVVEAVDPNVNVVIKQNNQVVQQLELEKGENRVTVRSGQYQIELAGRGDELVLSSNSLSIQRGRRTIVRITEKPRVDEASMPGTGVGSADMSSMMGSDMGSSGGAGMAAMPGMMPMGSAGMSSAAPHGAEEGMMGSGEGMPGASPGFGPASGMMPAAGGMMLGGGSGGFYGAPPPQPTFNGKTYGQWLAELETERNPERLTEAVRAFADLGEDELAYKSAASILQIMRRYGSNVIDSSIRGQLVQETHNALRQLPGTVVAEAAVEELRSGNTRSRNFLLNQFLVSQLPQNSIADSQGTVASSELQQALKRRSEDYVAALMNITATSDEAPEVRAGALGLLLLSSESMGIAPQSIDGLTEALRSAVGERNPVLVDVATRGLMQLDPECAELVPALIRQFSTNANAYYRHAAIDRLGDLGERAAPAVDSLVKLIEPWAKATAAPGMSTMYGGGGFSSMSGAGGFGGGGFGGGHTGYDLTSAAIQTLGDIGPSAKPALPVLQQFAAAQPPGDGYAQLAAEAIAKINGPNAPTP